MLGTSRTIARSTTPCRLAVRTRASTSSAQFKLREVELRLRGEDGPALNLVLPLDWRDVPQTPSQPPFWSLPWPGGAALAAYLLEHPDLVTNRRVIDLGCGVAPAGIAASMAGAAYVELTDHDVSALRCAQLSADANAAPVATRRFDWFDHQSVAGQLAASGQFDVACACEIFYEDRNVQAVCSFLPKLLRPGGLLLTSLPLESEYRSNATQNDADRVLKELQDIGFSVEMVSEAAGNQLPGQGPDGLAASRRVLIAELVLSSL